MRYERFHENLLPLRPFLKRLLSHLLLGGVLLGLALGIGVLGYHANEGMPWIDALLNASMILGGMGPVSELHTRGGKLFASAYALFSGIFFLATTGFLIAPVAHRVLHRLHLEEEDNPR